MKKVIGGKTYVTAQAEQNESCLGCAAQCDDGLCDKLHTDENGMFTPNICKLVNKIFKEQTMSEEKEKTALELVDDVIERWGGDVLRERMRLIKSAIEREEKNWEDEYTALLQISADRARIIADMTEQLKSAIVMRPISELPDRVPDGCMIVAVGKLRVIIKCWVWEPGDDVFPHEGETHFYILPLPKPARRLHPCYFPWCKGEVEALNYGGGTCEWWRVTCSKCGVKGPGFETQEAAEQEWGYAE